MQNDLYQNAERESNPVLRAPKKVCQNAPLLSFTHKARTFTSWGFVIT